MPALDMERLIMDMMGWVGVSKWTLRERSRFPWTSKRICLGNTLSHGISPQRFFTQEATIWCPAKLWSGLAGHGASLTVMKGGEYWLHTEEQLAFLDDWVKRDFLSVA